MNDHLVVGFFVVECLGIPWVAFLNRTSSTSTPQPTVTPEMGIGSTMMGKDGMTLLYVPAGEFKMGSKTGHSDYRWVHQVYLDEYWIDETEVTNGMYANCVADGACLGPTNTNSFTRSSYYDNSEFENYPALFMDWSMAKAYCEWAGRRLPTEAEWEKAARGTDGRTYPWGEAAPSASLLNFRKNERDTTEVGAYPAGRSVYGAYDMSGNVWEWVNDWYDAIYYQASPLENPQGPTSGEYRVLRGGSWSSNYDEFVSSTFRNWVAPKVATINFGFRCALGESQ